LADDLEINQEIVCSMLQAAGHSVDIVADGAEAVMAVQASAYDIVLMDIQMPGMDGITATRRIRELPAPAGTVPIIAITANVLPEQVTSFKHAGMNDHAGKPLKSEELHAAIARWAPASAQTLPAAAPVPESKPADAVPLDRETYGNLVTLMGREKVLKLLDNLGAQLTRTLEGPCLDVSDRERLGREAHAMVSMAGMLGFVELSGLCSEVEQACLGGLDLELFLARVRETRGTTLRMIAAMADAA
jgi:CheY-like chemotaxis protein/HPt (histidine-containing phosphotransfer) domain-containing protein